MAGKIKYGSRETTPFRKKRYYTFSFAALWVTVKKKNASGNFFS